jgi:hypothetical protein
MITSPVHKCPAKVCSTGSFWSHACGVTARHEHNGVMYCKTHHPPTAQAKDAARRAAWQADFDARQAIRAAEYAASKERDRRAELFPVLLRVLQLIDKRLRDCDLAGISATDAYDSFYREEVEQVLILAAAHQESK